MEDNLYEKSVLLLKALENKVEPDAVKKLMIDETMRVLKRLDQFKSDCETCMMHLEGYVSELERLNESDSLDTLDFKLFNKRRQQVIIHLTKQHKLVSDHYYLSITLPMGLMLGFGFGMLLFENIAVGLPLGLAVGIGIGLSLDGKAKNNDRII